MHRVAWISAATLVCVVKAICAESDLTYQKPPQPLRDALHAPLTPTASISPRHDYVLFLDAVRYPSITEVAQPMARLAGSRIDTRTNGMHLARTYTKITICRLSDGAQTPLGTPSGAQLGPPVWSPDGKHFAFTNTAANSIELWIAEAASGRAHHIGGISINAVVLQPGLLREPSDVVQWMPDNRTLLVRAIPAGRGNPPPTPAIPRGPHTQESLGHAGPAPTFEDLLSNSHDEELFDYFATAQLLIVDSSSGAHRAFGKPAIFASVRPSPDGQHVLVSRIHRPYSYQLPAISFPQDVEIWNRSGDLEFHLASLPLAEHVPLAGVRTGPRNVDWLPEPAATLVWAEALDGGNPKQQAAFRDRIVMLAAPFQSQPRQVFKTKERFRSLQPLANGKALVEDYERLTRILRTAEIDLANPDLPSRVIFTRNERDAYNDPGRPVIQITPNGRRVAMQQGNNLFLTGAGASPSGERPFLDRLNLDTLQSTRIFQADANGYETIISVLNDDGTRLLTRRESPTDPPNYFLRNQRTLHAVTHYNNPMPQAEGITKRLVTYKRADGVPLSFTLYLPAGYKPGTHLPAVLWAYPYEFTDASTAGQVTGHDAQSFPELNYHQLVVLHGYALLDNAAMPIIGDADTVNNTYVDQLRMDAQAAVDKAVELGITTRDRIGVFGHSYGAFMTANLLAHTDLFHAGIAESGAYNRTLTPFGFQTERRTFWEVPQVYTRMSPFWYADRIKTPLLLIHGEADDNTGTFPIQSERMYAAVRGNGGTVRLVMLPAEAHGYRAIESMEHVLWEELSWFDKFLKATGSSTEHTSTGSSQ